MSDSGRQIGDCYKCGRRPCTCGRDMKMTDFELFMLGYKIASRLQLCNDARDVGRLLTCEDFPEWMQAIASDPEYPGHRNRTSGIEFTMKKIKERLDG